MQILIRRVEDCAAHTRIRFCWSLRRARVGPSRRYCGWVSSTCYQQQPFSQLAIIVSPKRKIKNVKKWFWRFLVPKKGKTKARFIKGDQTLKCFRQARSKSKGRVPLFLVSKQNLNLSYWHIWRTKNCQKWNKIEKVISSKVKRIKNSKKNKPPNITKAGFWTLQKFLVCYFVDTLLFVIKDDS